jgi:hypothetical protein
VQLCRKLTEECRRETALLQQMKTAVEQKDVQAVFRLAQQWTGEEK